KLWVNGELKQSSNTRELIFGVGAIIEYISKAITLEPGDVIFTGTPAGVGFSRKPPEALKAGDTVRIAIDKLGVLENPVIEESES
ncbi:MAG TPA: fumarylacetoacetate hydrolase family protein, partial [Candidatus Binataceae bacterium]|nr:fumarylacetoacetate hydrolase family protein [Candidatus Binataceae bacterium]